MIPGVNPKEIEFVEVYGFADETERGSKGFGSTGRKSMTTSGSLGILGVCE